MINDTILTKFIVESNAIEGIDAPPSLFTLDAYNRILTKAIERITVDDLVNFVNIVADGAPLRLRSDQFANVGNHAAPRGGMKIKTRLETLLRLLANGAPYMPAIHWHNMFLWLHPFMDGNGRTARLMWMRISMEQDTDFTLKRIAALPILQSLYYDQIANADMDCERSFDTLERNHY